MIQRETESIRVKQISEAPDSKDWRFARAIFDLDKWARTRQIAMGLMILDVMPVEGEEKTYEVVIPKGMHALVLPMLRSVTGLAIIDLEASENSDQR